MLIRFNLLHQFISRSITSCSITSIHLVIGFIAIGILLPLWVTACAQNNVSSQPIPIQSSPNTTVSTSDAVVPTIAAAGDIACKVNSPTVGNDRNPGRCQMQATSDLLGMVDLAAVLPLGDLQYENGELDRFQRSYDPTWGRVKAITRPVAGNHEYNTPGAAGYFSYFGDVAGELGKSYYSYNIGAWHLIALNSNCRQVGGCGAGSPQVQWLKADLAAHSNQCSLAYWHHPRFSSGRHGNTASMTAFWQVLYEAGVEIVLNGHDHNYERFASQTPDAELDPERGIRQFVVGTGSKNLYSFADIQANSEVRNADTYGVLMLTLHPNHYNWEFKPIVGQSFTDSGEASCH